MSHQKRTAVLAAMTTVPFIVVTALSASAKEPVYVDEPSTAVTETTPGYIDSSFLDEVEDFGTQVVAPEDGAQSNLLNPTNAQNHVLTFEQTGPTTFAAATSRAAIGTVLSGSRSQRMPTTSSNYARVSFSTGVTLNRTSLPTRVQFDGESQVCFSLPSSPSSVTVTSRYTATGVALSASVSGSGATVSGSTTTKTATTKMTKKNPAKKTCINTVDRGISFTGAIVSAREVVVGEIVYKNTKYTIQVGDE
ncbi:hypothetical protein [Demequina oxidasica]|uniref:hypothetical protein n=1 Tax=Demequina oxidasica TaxID=676199 RepID=UPI000A91EB80|nr:hypothetical protein [Demequina oxidasica]